VFATRSPGLCIQEAANSAALAFVVHDGDIWLGGSWCGDERLRQVKGELNGFRSVVYTPGDNEWQDCRNGADGRLPAIRRIFFSSALSLGTQPVMPAPTWRGSTPPSTGPPSSRPRR
jgi:hypothetical protein